MDEDVADALKVRKYRHARLRLNAGHQAFPAAGHDHINVASRPCSISPTAPRSRVGTSWIDASGKPAAVTLGQRRDDGPAGAHAVRAASQDRRVARFHAKHAGIGRYVRPAFVDDPDSPQGAPAHARFACHWAESRILVIAPTGSLSARTTSIPAAMASTRPGVEGKAVEKRSCDPAARASATSSALAARMAEACARTAASHALQCAIFLLSRGKREHTACRSGTAADLAHRARNVGGSLDAFERRGHFPRKPWKALSEATFLPCWRSWARWAAPAWQSSGLGITWITPSGMQRIN